MKKVLMVTRMLDSGGVTTHIMSLARGLMDRGWEVGLAVAAEVGEDHHHGRKWFEDHGIRVFMVPFLSNVRSVKGWQEGLSAFQGLREVCRDWQPDLLHIHYRSTSIYAKFIERSMGIPFVSTLHLSHIPTGGLFALSSSWGRRSIAISQETARTLQETFRVPGDSIDLIYNGVDAQRFVPPTAQERRQRREQFGVAEQDFVLCELARLTVAKRHDVLLRAVRIIKDRGYAVKVLVAGTGDLEPAIKAHVADLDLRAEVIMCGYQNPRDVIWASDVNVLPSDVEGFPVSVVEAMLCGVPTIRTPAGGYTDQIIEGDTGHVVAFEDAEAIAGRVIALIENRVLLAHMQACCTAVGQSRFTHETMTLNTEKTYRRAVS